MILRPACGANVPAHRTWRYCPWLSGSFCPSSRVQMPTDQWLCRVLLLLQGIGAGFVPKNLKVELLDEVRGE